jgi:hypothetical protein
MNEKTNHLMLIKYRAEGEVTNERQEHQHTESTIRRAVSIKVKFCLCLYNSMKMYGEGEVHETVSKSFRTESIKKYMLTTINTR